MSQPVEHKRATRQRAAIMEALGAAGGFRSAQELHDELRASGRKVGLATVYRQLQDLADAGHVDALRNELGETIYRMCDSDSHHHHLVCRRCGTSVEIESHDFEKWADRVASRHGFTAVDHTAELYGLCGSCSGGA